MRRIMVCIIVLAFVFSCEKQQEKEIIKKKNEVNKLTSITKSVAPKYTILQNNDMSTASAKRLQVKLRVEKNLDEKEIRAICDELIPNYKIQKYDAVIFHFYLPDSDIKGSYTAGMAEWAPNGDWGKAGTVASGDYSEHMISIKISEPVTWKDKTGIPLEKRKKIYYELVAEEDRLYAMGVKDRSSKANSAIAKKYNLTIQQVKDIGSEGLLNNWPMP